MTLSGVSLARRRSPMKIQTELRWYNKKTLKKLQTNLFDVFGERACIAAIPRWFFTKGSKHTVETKNQKSDEEIAQYLHEAFTAEATISMTGAKSRVSSLTPVRWNMSSTFGHKLHAFRG
jgi:hypothetical protein